MALKILARAVRLLGFFASPLLTSPAAAAPADLGVLVAPLRDGGTSTARATDAARPPVAARSLRSRVRS